MYTFGPLYQLLYPTNIFKINISGEQVDAVSYGSDALDAHTDGVETQSVAKLGAFLSKHLSRTPLVLLLMT